MDSCQCPAGDSCTCQVITAYLRACQRAGIRRVPSNVTSLCHRMTSNTTSWLYRLLRSARRSIGRFLRKLCWI